MSFCSAHWRVVARAGVPHLVDVAALSPTDVWVVGTAGRDYASTPVIGHWDGSKLHVFKAFRPTLRVRSYLGLNLSGELTAIAATGPNDVWATGVDGLVLGEAGDAGRPVVMHWNGRRWSVVPTPRLRSPSQFDAVAARSRPDVWAAGATGTRPLVEHWDGRRWRVFDMRREGRLYSIDATSPTDAWAVGASNLTSPLINPYPLGLHWDGRRWRELAAFDASSTEGWIGYSLDAVDAVSANDVWTAWNFHDVGGVVRRWDGRQQRDAYDAPSDYDVLDIAAVSPTNVWGVGERWRHQAWWAAVFHRSGTKWSIVHSPLARVRTRLSGVSVVGPQEIWAVGDGLIARYSC